MVDFLRYGIRQKHSRGLRIYTVFTIIWAFLWAILWGLFMTIDVVRGGHTPADAVSEFLVANGILNGPFLAIQFYWQDSVLRSSGDIRPHHAAEIRYSGIWRFLPRPIKYGLSQELSSGLRTFSMANIVYTLIFAFVLVENIYEASQNMESSGNYFIDLFGAVVAGLLMAILLLGPVWYLQRTGDRKIQAIMKEVDYWRQYYRARSRAVDPEHYPDSRAHGPFHDADFPSGATIGTNSFPNFNPDPSLYPSLDLSLYPSLDLSLDLSPNHASPSFGQHPSTFQPTGYSEYETRPHQDHAITQAMNFEQAHRFEDAARLYEEMGRWGDAGRMRVMNIQVRASRSIFHVDVVNLTRAISISNSIISESSIGDPD